MFQAQLLLQGETVTTNGEKVVEIDITNIFDRYESADQFSGLLNGTFDCQFDMILDKIIK